MFCGQICTGSLTIWCKIEGERVDAVVDTEASPTIISHVVMDLSANGWHNTHRLKYHRLQLATEVSVALIGCGFVCLKLDKVKQSVKGWVAEVCNLCQIGFDLLAAGGCKIDLGWTILYVRSEELPFWGVSIQDKVEMEAPDTVTIPPGAEVIVPVHWWVHPT